MPKNQKGIEYEQMKIRELFKYPICLLSVFYILTRTINLLILPIFNDEAIYIDWGAKEINAKGYLFYSLYDGKPPLLMWIFGLAHKITSDPLLAARLVSVVAGLLTLIAIYKLSTKYFDRVTAIVASVFYIVIPLFVFFDRQALMESAIGAVGVWSIYLFLKFLEEKSLKNAIILGVIWGAGIFIKQNAVVFIIAESLIYFWLVLKEKLYKFDWNYILGIIVSQIILLPLYFQKAFWTTLSTNSRFTLTLQEVISFPISIWWKNISGLASISFWYLFPPIIVLQTIGLFKLKNTHQKIIAAFFLSSLFIITITARTISPRYLVSFLPLSVIFSACVVSLVRFKIKIIKNFLFILTFIIPAIFTITLINNPLRYFEILGRLTSYSQQEYVSSWTSGYGVTGAINYLKNISKNGPVVIGVRIDAGNPESAVFAYFNFSQNTLPIYFDSKIVDKSVFNYDCISTDVPFYFVARDGILAGMDKFLKQDKIFKMPVGENFVATYTLKGNCQKNVLKLTFGAR